VSIKKISRRKKIAMRVCHFISTNVGGSYFKNLTKGLAENGVTSICVELGVFNPPQWLSEVPQVKYFNLGIQGKSQYPLAIWRLASLLRREKIDILQTHLYYSGLIGVIAGRLARTPVVVLTRHHTSVVKMLGKNYHIALDRWMADSANHVVAVSEAVRQFMKESDGVRKNHIEVIHLGFDFAALTVSESERERVRCEFKFAPENFVIGYVGQFVRGKGQPQLLAAFNSLAKQIPTARLLFVGGGNDAEVKETVIELGLQDKVVFAGWRDDAAVCSRAMDVFVQPSLSEAFSQVIIEAMAVGTPVVATDVGGAREVITHRKNAMIIPPNEPAAIVDAVQELYDNRDLRESLARNAQKHVHEHFTAKKMVSKQLDSYKCWLSQKSNKI
jgi:glycosyltransferase involved in cell wall biosynthesis